MLYRCSEPVRDTEARALGVERSINASETWTAPSHGCQKARPRPVTFAMLCLREAATASSASNDPSHVAWEATVHAV